MLQENRWHLHHPRTGLSTSFIDSGHEFYHTLHLREIYTEKQYLIWRMYRPQLVLDHFVDSCLPHFLNVKSPVNFQPMWDYDLLFHRLFLSSDMCVSFETLNEGQCLHVVKLIGARVGVRSSVCATASSNEGILTVTVNHSSKLLVSPDSRSFASCCAVK